jgi:F-type H+-transporting ATPase subunit epsilon
MLRLTVVTPERPFLLEECLSVTVPGLLGELQILPGHAAVLLEISAGVVVYQKQNYETGRFMIGEGFLEVDQDEVNVLCEQARFKDEVDKSFEEGLLNELKGKEKTVEDDREQKLRSIELKRCAARLSLFE